MNTQITPLSSPADQIDFGVVVSQAEAGRALAVAVGTHCNGGGTDVSWADTLGFTAIGIETHTASTAPGIGTYGVVTLPSPVADGWQSSFAGGSQDDPGLGAIAVFPP